MRCLPWRYGAAFGVGAGCVEPAFGDCGVAAGSVIVALPVLV
jgi:hypothetical protein